MARLAWTSILCWVTVAAPGCGSATPSAPTPRISETFAIVPTLLPDGGVDYGPNVPIPTFVVRQAGPVDATVSFNPTADCQFVFSVCRGDCRFSNLESPHGPGPTLSVSGVLPPDTYQALLGARSGGRPLCTTVPAQGVPLPHTVTVVHP